MRQFKNTKKITDRTSTSVNAYFRDVSKYPLATIEEEIALAQKIHRGGVDGERAKKRLIEANLRFVVSVANAYRWCGLDPADLIAEGNIGLIKAAEQFDETRGFKFISYAVHWIRQSILSAIANGERTVRLPLNQLALIRKYSCLSQETMQSEQRMPSPEEFAAYAEISLDRANEVVNCISGTVSMDSPVGDEGDSSCLGDFIPSSSHTDSQMNSESLTYDMSNVLSTLLSKRECDILMRSFGINCKQQSLEEIADTFELSRERVRQIREKAIRRLRQSSKSLILTKYLS